MPAAKKEIIIDFSVLNKDALKVIQETTDKINNLKKVQADLKARGMENTEVYHQNAAVLKELNVILKANQKELENNLRMVEEEEGSLAQMRVVLKDLIKEYESLSAAERESAAGNDLLQRIDEQRTAVENLEHAMGDYRRQVGNYGKAVEELTGPVGKAVSIFKSLSGGTMSLSTAFTNGSRAVAAFGKQLLKLLANPIVAIIAAIAAVVMKLVDAFKKNDEAITALQTAFAGFKPIINAVNKAFEFLVGVITKALGGISKLMALIGGDAVKAEQEHVKRMDELEDAEREYTVQHAKNEAEIADLRDKAADRDKYTAEQRKQFLQQAMDIEERDAKERKRIAKERYEIAKKEAADHADTSDETKDKLAELEAAMAEADKEYAELHRSLLKEQNRFQKEIDKENEDAEKERQQKAKEWQKKQEDLDKQILDERRKNEDLILDMLQEGYEKQRELLNKQYDREIEDLQKRYDKLAKGSKKEVELAKQINQQIILLRAKRNLELAQLDDKFSRENLQKEFEYNLKKNLYIIANMRDGYSKRRAELDDQYNRDKAAFDSKMTQLEAQYNAYLAQGMTESANLIAKQMAQESDLFSMRTNQWQEDAKKLKENVNKEIRELTHANDIEQQLYNIEVDGFENKESRKSAILQREAEKRLEIAKKELDDINKQLADDPENEDLLLRQQQAVQNIIDAQKEVQTATKNTTDALKAEKAAVISQFTSIAGSLDSVLGAFNGMFEAMAESNEKYQKFATAMAISQIYVSMAASIAQAVQAAVQAGGFTGPAAPVTIPAFIAELVSIVATTIGSTIATINKAKESQPSTPRFWHGGMVGNETTTRTDDTVTAKLSIGEYVIRSKRVKELGVEYLDYLNYGNDKPAQRYTNLRSYAEGGYVDKDSYEQMKMAFSEALEEMPNPIVGVKEFTDVKRRVEVKENISR